MKIAVIYNRESQAVINLFGVPNRERYGIRAIRRIVNALRSGGHQVIALEGDKDLIDKLEEFMPRVVKGERPGMAFNLSYGIQGQARYTHVPGILEMVGVPYVGSGPLAHSLSLDKVVAKMLFVQNGLPTPAFAVLEDASFEMPELEFPLIIKPKNEAVSMGIKIVNSEPELREAAGFIFDQFSQPVLVERYIEGREINVGILGNVQPQPFVPAELIFGEGGPNIYTNEDKRGKSGREVRVLCPANIDEGLSEKAQDLAVRSFKALGCYDCARIDMRLDEQGNLYILEINSLPSLGEHGSYVAAAEAMGMDFPALVNRLVEVASARYFGTPKPPELIEKIKDPGHKAFAYLTERRDRIEKRLQSWSGISSRTDDPIGIRLAAHELDDTLKEIGLRQVPRYTDGSDVWAWETRAGLDNGTLLIGFLDLPVSPLLGVEHFRKDPEWLYGEGVGSSRASLVMMEYALRAIKTVRRLNKLPIGVLYYADEGRDCVESSRIISESVNNASRVIVMNSGNPGDRIVTSRRGQRRYRLIVEGKPRKLGQRGKTRDVMRLLFAKLEDLAKLSSRSKRVAVSTVDLRTDAYPKLLPHRARVTIQVSYPTQTAARGLESTIRGILTGEGLKWSFELISDRPPMPERKRNVSLANQYIKVADEWEIPLKTESSLMPSVAGLVPSSVPVICGTGPIGYDLFTNREAVSRISLVQRTLLLTEYLLSLK